MQLKCWRPRVLGFCWCCWERVSLCSFINPPGYFLSIWIKDVSPLFSMNSSVKLLFKATWSWRTPGSVSLVGTLSRCSLPQTGPPSKKILYSRHHNLILWAFKITLAKHTGFVGRRWSDSRTPGCQHSFSSGAWMPWNTALEALRRQDGPVSLAIPWNEKFPPEDCHTVWKEPGSLVWGCWLTFFISGHLSQLAYWVSGYWFLCPPFSSV